MAKPAKLKQQNNFFFTRQPRLHIVELTGHNIETRGREQVNILLKQGWLLLLVYTLRYLDNGFVRERPMAILGKPETISN